MPIVFEPSAAQSGRHAAYVGRGKGMFAALRPDGIELATISGGGHGEAGVRIELRSTSLRRAHFAWHGEDRLPGATNYFLGDNRSHWRTAVPHFSRVKAASALPGIDVVVYGSDEGLEYDLRSAPKMDLAGLRLKISGADDISLNGDGDLLFRRGGRQFKMRRPATYQESAGARRPVDCRYRIVSRDTIAFQVGPHDSGAPLIIDPLLTVNYFTFLGGEGTESANSLAVDATGKLYIGGTTTSASFSETAAMVGPGSSTDYFIAKIDPTQSGAKSLVYLTFLGGSGAEAGGLIAIDSKGNVAITGTTVSTDFPVTDASTRTSGTNDVTLSEIDPTGGKLIFSTLFGGNGAESSQAAGGIAFDKSGNIYVASDTTSTDLPVTAGAYHSTYTSAVTDGFLAAFTPPTTAAAKPAIKYCTYLGMNAQVAVSSLALDRNGNAYLTGFTSDPGSTFTTTGGFQTTYGGGDFDAFLLKLNPAGTGSADLVYATFLGGSGTDKALAVAVDSATPPNAYVTGTTQSKDFPVNGELAPFQSHLKAGVNATNAFVAVVAQNPSSLASALQYSTYLGGSGSDAGMALGLTTSNVGPVIYVAGATTSADFPWHDNVQPFNGDQDAFLARLEPNLGGSTSLVYATPFGGTAAAGVTALAQANAIATDGLGNIYLVGSTTASDFPRATHSQAGSLQVTCGSCQESPPQADAFVTQMAESSSAPPALLFRASSGARNLNFGTQNIGDPNVPPQSAAIFNSGDATLTIPSDGSAIAIQGPNAADFSPVNLQSCLGVSLSPGQQCTFEVGFVASQAGPEEAFLSVSDNAPGSPQVMALVATGSGPILQIPSEVNFGPVSVGTSTTMNATLSNVGNQALQIAQLSITGPDTSRFGITGGTCGTSLPAEQSCFMTIKFAPDSARLFQAEIDVTDNSGSVAGTKQTIALTGTGTSEAPQPSVNLAPTSFVFAAQPVGTSSGVQTTTVTNTGAGSLNISGIAITGTDAASFGVVKSGSAPCPQSGTVNPNANCTIGVVFSPQSTGAKSASLGFTDNASGSPQVVTLAGTGTAPAVRISPNSLNFGSGSVGVPSASQNIVITNTGNATLGFGSPGAAPFTFQGADAKDFSETDNCGLSLGNTPPNNTCTIAVIFKPAAPGTRSAMMAVNDNAAGSPQMIALGGTATQPSVSLSLKTLSFADEIGGTSSAAQSITVTNKGTGALAVTQISFSGANPADFSEKDTCTGNGVTVAPNSACTIQVTFTPQNDGAASASLMMIDNAPDSPESIALGGNGVDFALAAASGSSTTATVTAGQTANYSVVVTGGAGSVSLSCNGSPTAAVCSVPTTGAGGTPFTVSVSTTANAQLPPLPRLRVPRLTPIPWLGFAICLTGMIWILRRHAQSMDWVRCLVVAAFFAVTLSSCGGGGGSGDPQISGTPAGTYTINIAGSAGGANHNIPLTLVVK